MIIVTDALKGELAYVTKFIGSGESFGAWCVQSIRLIQRALGQLPRDARMGALVAAANGRGRVGSDLRVISGGEELVEDWYNMDLPVIPVQEDDRGDDGLEHVWRRRVDAGVPLGEELATADGGAVPAEVYLMYWGQGSAGGLEAGRRSGSRGPLIDKVISHMKESGEYQELLGPPLSGDVPGMMSLMKWAYRDFSRGVNSWMYLRCFAQRLVDRGEGEWQVVRDAILAASREMGVATGAG